MRGLDAALALGDGHALDAMDATLELHHGVDLVARDLELDGLESAGVRRAGREDLDLPAAARREALVHLEEVTCKDGRLVAASGAADLDDGVLLVVGVAGDEHDLDLVLETRELGLVGGEVLLQHLLLVRVGGLAQHLLGDIDVVKRGQVLARLGGQRRLVCVLLGDARVLLGIGDHRRVHHLLLELGIGLEQLF